ncbi:hypothetical protein PspLS_01843 [Pyricularia sp. CBS 133598]|nr:hypothetical protein PspLS_01843 [Pyricularia sp. CBS 133598]
MASELQFNISQPANFVGFGDQTSLAVSSIVTALLLALFVYSKRDPYSDLSTVNPRKSLELTESKRRADFYVRSREILAEGTRKFRDKPFKAITEQCQLLVLPPKYVAEIKGNPALDFIKFVKDETTLALSDVFTNSKEDWIPVDLRSSMRLVSRIDCRIFMGEDLANDPAWSKASFEYIYDVTELRNIMSQWPRYLRPIAYRFMDASVRIPRKWQACRDAMDAYMDKRNAHVKEALALGKPNPYDDLIEWFSAECAPEADKDYAKFAIVMFTLAVPNMADLLLQTLYNLAEHPELISTLREEVIQVLSTDGLKKTAFQKLIFMDACLKESHRLKPIYTGKIVESDVKLKDGFVIKKGTNVGMDSFRTMMDEQAFPEPDRYNPHRWVNMRKDQKNATAAFFSSTGADHHGFGHGLHACAGRFYASNGLKVILSHIVLKYDWKVAPGCEGLKPVPSGVRNIINPGTKVMVRRRKEELDLRTLATD